MPKSEEIHLGTLSDVLVTAKPAVLPLFPEARDRWTSGEVPGLRRWVIFSNENFGIFNKGGPTAWVAPIVGLILCIIWWASARELFCYTTTFPAAQELRGGAT